MKRRKDEKVKREGESDKREGAQWWNCNGRGFVSSQYNSFEMHRRSRARLSIRGKAHFNCHYSSFRAYSMLEGGGDGDGDGGDGDETIFTVGERACMRYLERVNTIRNRTRE